MIWIISCARCIRHFLHIHFSSSSTIILCWPQSNPTEGCLLCSWALSKWLPFRLRVWHQFQNWTSEWTLWREQSSSIQCWASRLQAGSPNHVSPRKENVNIFCSQKSQQCLTVVALSKNFTTWMCKALLWVHESQLIVFTLCFTSLFLTVNTHNQNQSQIIQMMKHLQWTAPV